VVENCEGPELLRAFWHAIEQVSILDPTCGSGAFLFAALNILEPLYEACLDRMEIFVDELARSEEKHRPEKFGDFRKVLERIEKHPNRRYFIFKSIIVNNLYGVDIMEEAIEICKLRLFLKLVAQIEKVENIEPLPDIDFNIRAGNTLVGYASYDEIRKAVLGDTQGKLDLGKDMDRIDEKAQDVDRLFKLFREQQTELGGEVTPTDKQDLRNRLKALEDELNRYLAGEYGIDPDKEAPYEKWLISHKPFHWFIEFYGIIHKWGGFNAIIGNPPYVEYNKVKEIYTIRGFKTQPCDNLYAFAWERSLGLARHDGHVGMIVPVSSVCTEGFESLQSLLLAGGTSVISSFNDRPSKLFEGLEHNRLCIILFQKDTDNPRTFSTTYNRWQSVERPQLFQNLSYMETTSLNLLGSFAKIGSSLEHSLVQKLNKDKNSLAKYKDSKGRFKIFYTRKLSHFVQILDFVPNITDDAGGKREPSELKQIGFRKEAERDAFLGLLNSNLFYWFITVYSDCRNLNRREVDSIRYDFEKSDPKVVEDLSEATKKLMADIRRKSKDLKMTYRDLGTLTIQCTYPKYSKSIINKIDHVFANHYGFTHEELDFIISCDIKYRMGRDSGGEEED
jgi:methylase of polypeptide subunit release factors